MDMFFLRLLKILLNPNVQFTVPNDSFGHLHLAPIQNDELDKIIASFERKFPVGYDNIAMFILKSSKLHSIKLYSNYLINYLIWTTQI